MAKKELGESSEHKSLQYIAIERLPRPLAATKTIRTIETGGNRGNGEGAILPNANFQLSENQCLIRELYSEFRCNFVARLPLLPPVHKIRALCEIKCLQSRAHRVRGTINSGNWRRGRWLRRLRRMETIAKPVNSSPCESPRPRQVTRTSLMLAVAMLHPRRMKPWVSRYPGTIRPRCRLRASVRADWRRPATARPAPGRLRRVRVFRRRRFGSVRGSARCFPRGYG